jgi:hypothetical protein
LNNEINSDGAAARRNRDASGEARSRKSPENMMHLVSTRPEPATAGGLEEASMSKGEIGGRSDSAANGRSPTPADVSPDTNIANMVSDGIPPADVEPAMVDRGMQAQLGQQLRALFDHVAGEPVPDRLLKLLAELESKEKKR